MAEVIRSLGPLDQVQSCVEDNLNRGQNLRRSDALTASVSVAKRLMNDYTGSEDSVSKRLQIDSMKCPKDSPITAVAVDQSTNSDNSSNQAIEVNTYSSPDGAHAQTSFGASSQNEISDVFKEEDQRWARSQLKPFDPWKKDIIFQQIEIHEDRDSSGPVVRMFGVTDDGHSVLCSVRGFLPYFFIPAPIGFQQSDLRGLQNHLNMIASSTSEAAVQSLSITRKENMYGFQGNEKVNFIKITCAEQKLLTKIRGLFERGEVNYENMFPAGILTFESNISYTMRFMIDAGIVGMGWITVPAGKYSMIDRDKISNCQIEITTHYDDIISHNPEGEWQKMAPLRVLSFDIECAGRKGIFPEAEIDPVITIANVVTTIGEPNPFIRNVFCIDTCAHIVGCQVMEHTDQAEMLLNWANFVREVDPDVIIGYNIANFDLPYLIDRANHLNVAKFPYLGKLTHKKSEIKDATFSSKAYGTRDSKVLNMEGRLQFDMLQVIQRDFKLRSYTLNAVCAEFLAEQKEDVHHSIITDLQNGTADSRRRLAVYCLKDAVLPQRLMDKLMSFLNYTEMARVTGVPFNDLLSRGQQAKVISQLYRKALQHDLLVPNMRSEGSEEQYEGATVIEPIRGYYDSPIATLDFSSLYPSIMQAHNLCYTTLLNPTTIENYNLKKDKDYIVTPNGDCFVKPELRKGLLPVILAEILSARKRAKTDLKKETDPFRKAILNGRQLALKVSANSVYGFTGATNGRLPCLQISSSTTSYGRQMIEKTKSEVENRYTIVNGYKHDAIVIYGDTDSVMVKFGESDLKKVMELGQEAAQYVTSKFVSPIKLEFEKVYFPYLLINKKRYAGLYWTNPEKFDKMDAKGIETVRRDNCRLVSIVIETSLKKLLINRDVNGAVEYAKQMISDLLQNKVDMSQLVITKALSKADYTAKQPHVELAERMRKRDSGSAPALGDRVAYVIIKGASGEKLYARAEDPIYVLENNIPIDTKYYLENQLSNPLLRIFEPILGEKVSSLITGAHTRTISVSSPSIGGLMKFAVRTTKCLGCRAALKNSSDAVCENCRPRIGELLQKQIAETNEMSVRFARLWTQCQRCQGSLHQDILCTAKDCPIFYMRKKAQKDMSSLVETMHRFDKLSW